MAQKNGTSFGKGEKSTHLGTVERRDVTEDYVDYLLSYVDVK